MFLLQYFFKGKLGIRLTFGLLRKAFLKVPHPNNIPDSKSDV